MVDPGRWNVPPHGLASDFPSGQQPFEQRSNTAQPRSLGPSGHDALDPSYANIFEEREDRARLRQLTDIVQDGIDLGNREVIQRQSGNDDVVARVAGQVLKAAMQDANALGLGRQEGARFELLAEPADELLVQLDQVESVRGLQGWRNVPGHRAGAWPHFEDASRPVGRRGDKPRQCLRQSMPAG